MEQLMYVLAFCLYVEGQPCDVQGGEFDSKEVCEQVRDDNRELEDLPGVDGKYRLIVDCELAEHKVHSADMPAAEPK